MTENEIEQIAQTLALKLQLQPQHKEWMTPKDIEEELGMSETRQANLRFQKIIPFHKQGRYIRYKRSDINVWLEAGKVV